MNTKCAYCDNESIVKSGIFICEKCKTVCYTKDCTDFQKKELVYEFLKSKKVAILKQQENLHEIDQKVLNGIELTATEQEICDNLSEFKEIYSFFKANFEAVNVMHTITVKKYLYRLLFISEWLTENY
ncbi:MAG: hypothetical protein E7530_02290 [Ruminococcaceae bacterium]|nr:hypothetical protein [Oscillospiraceae bacterium]